MAHKHKLSSAAPAEQTTNAFHPWLESFTTQLEQRQSGIAIIHGEHVAPIRDLLLACFERAQQVPGLTFCTVRTTPSRQKLAHLCTFVAQLVQLAETQTTPQALITPLREFLSQATSESFTFGLTQKLHIFHACRQVVEDVSSQIFLVLSFQGLEQAERELLQLVSDLAESLLLAPERDPASAASVLLLLSMRSGHETPVKARHFFEEMIEHPTVQAVYSGQPAEHEQQHKHTPSNIAEIFQHRLLQISADQQHVLAAIALSNHAVSATEISVVTGQSESECAKLLIHFADQHILGQHVHDGELRFSYLRRADADTTERNLSFEKQQAIHTQWATHLAQKDAELARICFHQLRSPQPERGVLTALSAAEQCVVAGQIDTAIDFLDQARPFATGDLRIEVLARLSQLWPQTGSPRTAMTYLEEWKSLLPAGHHGPALRAEAELQNILGEYHESLRVVDAARRELPHAIHGEHALVESVASEAWYQLGEYKHAEACAQHGLKCLESSVAETELRTRIVLLNQLGKVALVREDLARAHALYREMLAVAERHMLRREEALANINLGVTELRACHLDRAEDHLNTGILIAREVGDTARLAFGLSAFAAVQHERGNFLPAVACGHECVSLFRQLRNTAQLVRATYNLANSYFWLGDLARAQTINQEALTLAEESQAERILHLATALDGTIAWELGQKQAGETKLQAALAAANLGNTRSGEIALDLAELCLASGDLAHAHILVPYCLRYVERAASTLLQARAQFISGWYAVLCGHDTAAEALHAARTFFVNTGYRRMLKDVEHMLALAAQQQQDLDTARQHLAAAFTIQATIAAQMPVEVRARYLEARPQRSVIELSHRLQTKTSTAQRVATTQNTNFAAKQTSTEPVSRIAAQQRSAEGNKQSYAHYRATIVGHSPKLTRLFQRMDRIAPTEQNVLILGESGTGKELVAEALHRNSPRKNGPFVKLNCGALVESLLLSELFGHERGAFTGAHQKKLGRFELAAGGTIFLDEIGDISPKTQVALLRVLQEREFERVGGAQVIEMRARIIFATHRDLGQMVRDGLFREDLYYRLHGITLEVPALRERVEDIAELVQHFCARFATENVEPIKTFSEDALYELLRYSWPGNIRELENIIRSVALFAEGPLITRNHLFEQRALFQENPAPISPNFMNKSTPGHTTTSNTFNVAQYTETGPLTFNTAPHAEAAPQAFLQEIFDRGVSLPELKHRLQTEAIRHALQLAHGNITKAAELLGMRRPRLSQIVNGNSALKQMLRGNER